MNLQFNYYTISSLSIALSCLFFAIVLCRKNSKSIINRSFITFSVAVMGWSFFYFLWQLSYDYDTALAFTKFMMFFSALIPPSYLFAVLAYTEQLDKKMSRLMAAYFLSLPLSVLAFSNQIISSLGGNQYHSLWPLAGQTLDVFLVIWFSILTYSNLLLYEVYKTENDKLKKSRLLLLMVGFSLSFLGGATNFFLWYNIAVPPLGNFIGPVFIVFISYAVLKLGFLDASSAKAQISTFWNDILFNPFRGFSVVTDKDVFDVLKNYHNFSELEKSSLLNLNTIKKRVKKDKIGAVDALRIIIEDATAFFEPKNDKDRRTKQNLKYHLLKMLTFDEAEEGQILWELGFDEYPVKLMRMEKRERPPRFRDFSPADYHYTSRNAYLALKREAIHDVTWRISYLEKLNK